MPQSADGDLCPRRYGHQGTCPAFYSSAVNCRILHKCLTDGYEPGALRDQNIVQCAAKPDWHPLSLWKNRWNICLFYTNVCTN